MPKLLYVVFAVDNLAILLPTVQCLKTGAKRPAAATESVAQLEDAHVTFQDAQGHERADVVMLDPGTSAFLCGFGPARRYLTFLAS